MYQNLTQLAQLTGFSKETVGKRLAEAEIQPLPESPGNAKLFDSVAALPAIYNATPSGQSELVRERTRVSRAVAEKKERDLMLEKRELLREDEVAALINASLSVIRNFCAAFASQIEMILMQHGITATAALLDEIERAIDSARNTAADGLLRFADSLPESLS
jgi:hypothetical protein